MNLQLTDKVALVSGSTAGIGFAIAIALAQEGATVVINGRTQERVDAAIDQIKQKTPDVKLQGIVADLGTLEGANALFQPVPEVDILVNNLGIYGVKAFAEISDDEWMQSWDADLIVIGRRGHSGLSELILGSVSNYVFHHAPCSIHVVHATVVKAEPLVVNQAQVVH